MSSAVVLFSGGIDSTVVLHEALTKYDCVVPLMFEYGQEHECEVDFGVRICEDLSLEPVVRKLPHFAASGTPANVFAARNMLFVAHGVALASVLGCSSVLIGANSDDHADYPDCRPAFIKNMNDAASAYGISVRAPLWNLTKRQVVLLGELHGIDFTGTISCYRGTRCGECNACKLRISAGIPA